MCGEVVDWDLAIFTSKEILKNLIGSVEIQGIRMIEVVVMRILMILL
jgi:hypothetical protein